MLHSASYSLAKFDKGNAAWVEIDLPNIVVSDKFYVHIYRQPTAPWSILVASDDSIPNEHSTFTDTQTARESWPYETPPKTKVNWMIRVVGTGIFSEY